MIRYRTNVHHGRRSTVSQCRGVSRSPNEEVSFAERQAHAPPEMVAATFSLSPETVAKFPRNQQDVVPG
jgi:hypothetical protein